MPINIPTYWPADFVQRMQNWLATSAGDFFAALAQRDVGLRLNPRRGALDVLRAGIPWKMAPVPWCPEGLWLQEKADIGKHPYHRTGVFYSQDPSAMAAGVLLDPQPGEWVLDLAAAPGGKATHIAGRMQGQGVLVANDTVRRRASVLAMNLERLGVSNAIVTNESPERLASRWAGLFDALLVDAPCSGEGMFSHDTQAARAWSLNVVKEYAWRQKTILHQSAALVRPGGRLLYGTCTFSPEENEGVIAYFLDEHPDFILVDLPAVPGLYPGRPEWLGLDDDLRRTGRFWPHTGPGHGHFYALLRRIGTPPDDLPECWQGKNVPGRTFKHYRNVMRNTLTSAPPEKGVWHTADNALYHVVMPPYLWERLRVLRPGLWLATVRHNKLYPDHALAMTLHAEDACETWELAEDATRLRKYLGGGFWPDRAADGFVLITYEGFPLGWAKRGGGRMRSRYPVHLRR